ncbi:uncharacterized protein LOC128739399 [Sabethes cyaneus]|uniref:uncharacterized protein LOC128739399 n=1 Tax=Sabethes cyaneus TaxID=53552 RepID=UPI00237DCE17|nr:uncharacterized protein LOC128739399 [Sabethes cyaneus]
MRFRRWITSWRSLTWWFPVRNNLDSVNQLHLMLKLFGVLVYTVIDRVNYRIQGSLSDWLLLTLFTVVRCYAILDGALNGHWTILIQSDLAAVRYGMGFTVFFMMVLFTVVPFYLLIQHKRFEALLTILHEFDEEVSRYGYLRDHRYHHFRTTMYLLICLTVLTAIFAVAISFRPESSLWNGMIFIGNFTEICFAITLGHAALIILIFSIHSRVQLLNQCICEKLSQAGSYEEKRKSDLVNHMARMYDKLCDATEIISIVVCAPLFLNFINIFFLHVISCYACMRVLLSRATPSEATNAMLYLSWSGYFNVFVFQTIGFASALRQQAAKFAAAVHHCLNQPHNQSIIDRLQQLSEQIDNRGPFITFYLFELHPSLIIQAGGELATYMLILIQFEMQ